MIADRELVEQWEDERDDLIHLGYLRIVGSHPNGEPKCVRTWKGHRAVFAAGAREAWDALCLEAEQRPWAILTILGGGILYVGIRLVQHAYGFVP